MEVVLARMASLRRAGPDCLPQLRDVYQHALQLLPSVSSGWVDRDLRLTDTMARCEAAVGLQGGLQGARTVWEQAVKGALGKCVCVGGAYACVREYVYGVFLIMLIIMCVGRACEWIDVHCDDVV